ncbi:unnamed protein product, partial [Vitis vinifera]
MFRWVFATLMNSLSKQSAITNSFLPPNFSQKRITPEPNQ